MAERPIKSLSDLMDGGLEERFNQELTKVWQNVYDPNTNPTAARKVVMEVKIVPKERRDSVQFHVNVSSKLAPHVALTQTVMLSLGADGTITATERTEQVPGSLTWKAMKPLCPAPSALGGSKQSSERERMIDVWLLPPTSNPRVTVSSTAPLSWRSIWYPRARTTQRTSWR